LTRIGHSAKTRLASAVLALAMFGVAPVSAKEVLGVILPNGAKELGPNRYRSPLDHAATVSWIKRRMRKIGVRLKFKTAIDLPEVVSAHAESPSGKTRWSGINVSLYDGAVTVFLIERR